MCNVHFLNLLEIVTVMKKDKKCKQLIFWMLKENPISFWFYTLYNLWEGIDISCCVVHNCVKDVVRKRCLLQCCTQLCEKCREEEMSLVVLYTTVWRMSWERNVSCCVAHNCVKNVVRKRCLLLCCTQLCEGCREEEMSLAVLYTTVWRKLWGIDVSCCVVRKCVKDVVRNICLSLYCTRMSEGCHEVHRLFDILHTTVWRMSWGKDIFCCVVHNCVNDVSEISISLAVLYTTI